NAVLIESSAPLDLAGNDEALRLLEATRYTSLMVSTYTMSGRLLSRNPAAIDVYGASAQINLGEAARHDGAAPMNDLDRHLGDPQIVRALKESVAAGTPFARDVRVRTAQGPHWHQVQAHRGRDPRTGEWVIVITESDV